MAYSDEKMTYKESTGRYYLTEDALLNKGVDVRARYTAAGIDGAGAAVDSLLEDATNIVYNYAHECVFQTDKQDYVLANDDTVRDGLYRALLAMAISLARFGNRLDSVEESERAVAIPSQVKAEFDIVYPSLGHTLRYAGRW